MEQDQIERALDKNLDTHYEAGHKDCAEMLIKVFDAWSMPEAVKIVEREIELRNDPAMKQQKKLETQCATMLTKNN